MKRRCFTVGALASAMTLLVGCGEQHTAAANTQEAAASAAQATVNVAGGEHRYVIGVDDTFAPMEFRDAEGVLIGYDIDLAAAVMERAGLLYEFKPINWSKKEAFLLQDKSVDVIWSTLHITPERKSIFAFSQPYMKTKFQAVVPQQSGIRSRADLEGKVIGYKASSAVSVALLQNELPGGGAIAKAVAFPETSLAMAEMLAGKVDAVIDAHQPLHFYSVNSPGKFRVLDDVFMELEAAVAVRPADGDLLEKINRGLSEVEADGTVQRIHQRWFNAD